MVERLAEPPLPLAAAGEQVEVEPLPAFGLVEPADLLLGGLVGVGGHLAERLVLLEDRFAAGEVVADEFGVGEVELLAQRRALLGRQVVLLGRLEVGDRLLQLAVVEQEFAAGQQADRIVLVGGEEPVHLGALLFQLREAGDLPRRLREDQPVLEDEVAEPVLGERGREIVVPLPRRGLRCDLPVLDVDRPDFGGGRRVAAGVVLADGDVEDALAADAVAGRRRDADVLEGDLRLLRLPSRRSGGTRGPDSGRRRRRGR